MGIISIKRMDVIYILWGLSALFIAIAVWIWRMPEKDWLFWMSYRNYFNIDFHKYNNKKVRTLSVAFGLFEGACLFLTGLDVLWRHGPLGKVDFIILGGCIVLAPIVYWLIFLLYCKKSKYKKK